MSTHPAYRPDIDGLRAIAVLSVVAYHAFPSAVSGGFVGVDVFFVISGYLISSIILKSMDCGKFTFGDFYARRIRRILPALLVVLIACLAFGWLVLMADEFDQLGKHVAAGAAFLANVVFWDEVEYFDIRAELKPLLHLWSLGVEEQFYIAWPLMLGLAWRFRSAVPALIFAVMMASFLLNIGTVQKHEDAAFYLPFARFWELLGGSLLAYFTLLRNDSSFAPAEHQRIRVLLARLPDPTADSYRRWSNLSSIVGAILLLLAFTRINSTTAFPGWAALMPTCGTLLLISAGSNAWFNRNILAQRGMVLIGLISYPLYLWHWPLLSFARIIDQPTTPVVIVLILASIILAWLTYRFVEVPIRWQKRSSEQEAKTTKALVAALICITLVGFAVWGSVIPGRLDSVSRDIELAMGDWDYPGDGLVGEPGEGTILFFGDSFIRQYYPRVEKLSRSGPWAKKTLLFETEGGCAPYIGVERRGWDCNTFAENGYRLGGRDDVETIVLGASWIGSLARGDYYRVDDPGRTILDLYSSQSDWIFSNMEDRIREWIENGKRVYIILANPSGPDANPSSMISNRLAWTPSVVHRTLSLAEHRMKGAFVHDKLRQIAKRTGASVIDPSLWLCEDDVCATESAISVPMYCDDGHLRASFVREEVIYLDAIVGDDD